MTTRSFAEQAPQKHSEVFGFHIDATDYDRDVNRLFGVLKANSARGSRRMGLRAAPSATTVGHHRPIQVTTNGKAEVYDVLPEFAGLLQLIKDGAIAVQGEDLLVTKPITRFPAEIWVGMINGNMRDAKRFVLATGVPAPEADYRRLYVARIGADGKRSQVRRRD